MNLLVTGGAGFIGSTLVDRLIADATKANTDLGWTAKICFEDWIAAHK
jgi:nucleoside-diphosphate-sugar epimerase